MIFFFFFLHCINVTFNLRYFPSRDCGHGFISPLSKPAVQNKAGEQAAGPEQQVPLLVPKDLAHKVAS